MGCRMGPALTRFETVAAVMDGERGKPYRLGGRDGATDCLIMGLRVIDALHGSDFAAEAIGAYRTQRDVVKLLRKRGYSGFADIFGKRVRLERKPAGMAAIGDVAVIDVAGQEHVAVFNGLSFTTITETGPASYDSGFVKACFRV